MGQVLSPCRLPSASETEVANSVRLEEPARDYVIVLDGNTTGFENLLACSLGNILCRGANDFRKLISD